MKALRIDFASPSLARALRQLPLFLGIGLFLGLAVCINGAVNVANLLQQQTVLQLELQSFSQHLASQIPRSTSPLKSSITELQAKAMNGAIAQLNLPWRDMLDAVESATPDTVALLSLEPDGKKRSLRGTAEAKAAEDMLRYIQALKQESFFDGVVLTKHMINEQDPNKPLRFQFEAHWKGEDS